MAEKKEKKPKAEKVISKSLDEEIGKGLTPKKEDDNLDQQEKDFATHPKFAKFKK